MKTLLALTLAVALSGCATVKPADLAATAADLVCALPVVDRVGCGVALGVRAVITLTTLTESPKAQPALTTELE